MLSTSEEVELQRVIHRWIHAAARFQALHVELTDVIAKNKQLTNCPNTHAIHSPGQCSFAQLEALQSDMTSVLEDLLRDINSAGGAKNLGAHVTRLSTWNQRIRRILDCCSRSAS